MQVEYYIPIKETDWEISKNDMGNFPISYFLDKWESIASNFKNIAIVARQGTGGMVVASLAFVSSRPSLSTIDHDKLFVIYKN